MNKDKINTIEKLMNIDEFKIEKAPFAQLYNFVIVNLIDPDAFHIWAYYQSKPSNWRPQKKEIESHFLMGRDRVHKAHMVLKECGLYEPVAKKVNGQYAGWDITIRCGFGLEDKILEWKKTRTETYLLKKNKQSQNIENQPSGENQNTENPYSGENEAQQGVSRNTENTESGKHVGVINKEGSLQKKVVQDLRKKGEEKSVKKSGITPNPWVESTFDTAFKENEVVDASIADKHFKEFFAMYPKKTAENLCRSQWIHEQCDDKWPMIRDKLKEQIEKDHQWLDGYIPSPFNYITREQWNDDIVIRKKQSKPNQTSQKGVYDHESTEWAKTGLSLL